jgi:phosphopantetheinyl transferase
MHYLKSPAHFRASCIHACRSLARAWLDRRSPHAALVNLTSVAEHESSAIFAKHATDWERLEAERRGITDCGRYVHAHGALRLILGRALDVDLAAITLTKSRGGQLFVAKGPSISISYCGEEAYLAVDRDPIGLDVVDVSTGGPGLATSFVADDEVDALSSMAAGCGRPDLLVWAAKEAAAKLSDDVTAEPEAWRLVKHRATCRIKSAHPDIGLKLVQLGRGHVAALASWLRPRHLKMAA